MHCLINALLTGICNGSLLFFHFIETDVCSMIFFGEPPYPTE